MPLLTAVAQSSNGRMYMRKLSWIVLPIAMLTLVVVALATRTHVLAEEEEKAKAEEREWGEEVRGLRLSIQLKEYDKKEYGPVTLSIVVKNVSENVVNYIAPSLFFDYGLTVKDSKGDEVPLTRYGERIRNSGEDFKRALVNLKPEEQKEYTLVVSRYYDLTLPGTYTIVASLPVTGPPDRAFGLPSDPVPVTSNTITVKVPE